MDSLEHNLREPKNERTRPVFFRKRTQVRAASLGLSLPPEADESPGAHLRLPAFRWKRTQVRALSYSRRPSLEEADASPGGKYGTKARLSPKRGVCFHSAPYPHIFTICNVCPLSAAVFPQGILHGFCTEIYGRIKYHSHKIFAP